MLIEIWSESEVDHHHKRKLDKDYRLQSVKRIGNKLSLPLMYVFIPVAIVHNEQVGFVGGPIDMLLLLTYVDHMACKL